MLAWALLVEAIIVIAAPLIFAVWLRKRWPLPWSLFGAGAVTFVASQVVHMPFNAYLLVPALKGLAPTGASLLIASIALGLSAGTCEELARYATFRFWRRRDHNGPAALMLGAGHGGIESIVVGLLALQAGVNAAFLARVGLDNVGLSAAQQVLAASQLSAPAYFPLLGAVERLVVVPLHVSLSCMVMVATAKRRPALLWLAIVWHGAVDAACVWCAKMLGPTTTELMLLATLPVSIVIIRKCLAALAPLPRVAHEPSVKPAGEVLEFVGVEKNFGEVQALKGVTLAIGRGERACLLGPNGAGKTTAIRILNGALAPSAGWAFLFGTHKGDRDLFLAAKRRVGVVPQQPGMYEELTCRQYLDFVRELYDAPDYEPIAQRLGLSDALDRSSSTLSGGMQRRLSLAAALLSHPDLLILDEPSAGLDPIAAREMIDLIREESAGRTLLLCTHDLDEAEQVCDSVVILRGGRVLLHESIAKLRQRRTPMLAIRALGESARLEAALLARGFAPRTAGNEVQVPFSRGEEGVAGLLRELLDERVAVCECRIVVPSLEEIFLDVVRAPEGPPAKSERP